MTKKIICILGMHRSGTSLLCEILHSMGVSFGTQDELIAGNTANPDGYFELKKLAELMMDIYIDAGKMSMDPCWLDLSTIPQSKKEWYCNRIYQCLYPLVENCPEHQIFAIKHPRICILLPWLKECFDKMHVKVEYIAIIRNPLETAQSLWKRDCYPIDFGLHLWEKHNAAILSYAKLSDTLFLNHQMLFDDFDSTYQKIATFLHLKEDYFEKTKALINPNYRHHDINLDSYSGRESIDFIKDFYETLLHFCNAKYSEEIEKTSKEKLEQYFIEDKIFQENNLEYLTFCRRRLNDANRPLLKFKTYYNFLLRWMEEKAAGNSLEEKLLEKELRTVAIYGMGKIGKLVYNELKEGTVQVACIIDRNPIPSPEWSNTILATPDETEKYLNTDAVLIASIASYQEICNSLHKRGIYQIINLDSLWQ